MVDFHDTMIAEQSWSFLLLKFFLSIVIQRGAHWKQIGRKDFWKRGQGRNTCPKLARLNVCSTQFVARQHRCTRGVARGSKNNAIICSVGCLAGCRVGERFCVHHLLVSRINSGVCRSKMTTSGSGSRGTHAVCMYY